MNKPSRRKLITAPPPIRAKPPLDRFADWLGQQSRLARTLISAGVALALTIGLALVLYGVLFSTIPSRLSLGPLNANNLPTVFFVFLVIAGFAFYWVGWQALIGFDFEETPLQPGRPAALWVLFGVAVLIVVVLMSSVAFVLAARG